MDDVVCSGSEDYLQDCTYSLSDNCGSYDGAGVLCYTSCSATTTTTTIHDKNVEWLSEEEKIYTFKKLNAMQVNHVVDELSGV